RAGRRPKRARLRARAPRESRALPARSTGRGRNCRRAGLCASAAPLRPQGPETPAAGTAATPVRLRPRGHETSRRIDGTTGEDSATWRSLASLEDARFRHAGRGFHLHFAIHGQRSKVAGRPALALEHRLLVDDHIDLLFVLALPDGQFEAGSRLDADD